MALVRFLSIFSLLVFLLVGCRKKTEIIKDPIVDNYIYEVNGEVIYQSNVQKDKQKTPEQYISILHANLYQTAIPQDKLADLGELRLAIGDKQMADELILNGMVNDGGVILPTNTQMRADIPQFIQDTYVRFFLRNPTPYELYELKRAIEADPNVTPELIYQGFALSNEYKFY